MMDCTTVREHLPDLGDDVLATATQDAVVAHLATCAACRDEHDAQAATRAALADVFAQDVASAPPAPAPVGHDAPPPSTSPWRTRLWSLAYAAAAGIVILIAVQAFSSDDPERPRWRDPSPLAVVHRAAEHYGSFRDARLVVTMDSQVISFLESLGDKKETAERPQFEILLRNPRYILYRDLKRGDGPRKVGGFDGERNWEFDPEEGVVKLHSEGTAPFTINVEGEPGLDHGLASYLTWGFTAQLAKSKAQNVKEITGPSDERAGRRVFRIENDSGDKGSRGTGFTVTIDPERDLIEKIVFDIGVHGINILRFTIELAETDQGLPESLFRYQSHAPVDAPVVEVKPEDGKKPKGRK